GRPEIHDLGAAIDRLPSLTADPMTGPEAMPMQATGTEWRETLSFSYRTTVTGRDESGVHGKITLASTEQGNNDKPLDKQGVESERDDSGRIGKSSPSRTRTYNKPVNSRLLYH